MNVARSVHRLDIAAPSAALARRAGLLVEDALRTASLPGDGAELVLVRRLDLTMFEPRVSPQGVALKLESACRALAPVNGHDADDAVLAAAGAVRFADALDAHLALCARLLAGRPARAWCWALAVPGYRPDAGIGAGLRSAALSLAQREEGPAALPHWFARVVAWRGIERLLLALDADDAALIQDRCRPSRPATAVEAEEAEAWQRARAWVASTLAREDPRRALFESMAAGLAWGPETEGLAGLAPRWRRVGAADPHRGRNERAGPESGKAPPEGTRNTRPPARAAEAARTGTETRTETQHQQDTHRADDASAPTDRPAGPAARPAQSARPPLANTAAAAGAAPDPEGRHSRPAIGVPTHGVASPGAASPGLASHDSCATAFTAPDGPTPYAGAPYRPSAPIKRASAAAPQTTPGDAPARRAAPRSRTDVGPLSEPALAGATLRGARAPHPTTGGMTPPHALDAPTRAGGLLFLLPVLERVGLPAWLEAHPADRGTLPAQVMGALLHRLRVDDDDPAWWLARSAADTEAQLEAARWLAACRRHLRLAAGIGLASLCLRPAQLVITPTHAEVWLAFEQLDLRVRRAGLDIDPGWVPWFGRVVRFHYGRRVQ